MPPSQTFRRKPLEFEAIQWSDLPGVHETVYAWMKASKQNHRYETTTGILRFTTREGGVGCQPGNWLIRDEEGEVYPILDRRFRRLYEAVESIAPERVFQNGDTVRVDESVGVIKDLKGETARVVFGDRSEIPYHVSKLVYLHSSPAR